MTLLNSYTITLADITGSLANSILPSTNSPQILVGSFSSSLFTTNIRYQIIDHFRPILKVLRAPDIA
jgi:hypothetical protein